MAYRINSWVIVLRFSLFSCFRIEPVYPAVLINSTFSTYEALRLMKKLIPLGLSVISLIISIGTVTADEMVTVVDIESGTNRFSPEIVTIPKGGTVRWVNSDSKQPSHDFASLPGLKRENRELKVIELREGDVAEHTFNTPGVYDYFCYIHKSMVGRIIVGE